MATLSAPNTRSLRAPEKSVALMALQGKGLELPSPRKDSISPQSSFPFEERLKLSPLSIISTPSNLDVTSELGVDYDGRRPSATSFETEVSNILNLYMNSSRQSLRSEYEEETAMESGSDDDIEEERISVPSFHQPKAYRDTIAPLLEHQFSGDRLTVPSMPSPMSVASMPLLIHPNAVQSVPSLDLTPDPSPNLQPVYASKAAMSGTSIQITPEMSPQPLNRAGDDYSHAYKATDRKVALEVPDVREADSWYNYPLSPVSPEEITRNLRDSQMSAVSPDENIGYQRQLTFDALVPPRPQQSPNARPISYYEDAPLPIPSKAIITEIVDNRMVPPPLDLNRSKSPSNLSERLAPVHQPTMHISSSEDSGFRSHHASLLVHDPIEGPMRTYLTPPPPNRRGSASTTSKITTASDMEEIYRLGSAFSDSTVDSPVATAKFGKQLKKAFKLGKKRKKHKSSKNDRTEAEPAAVSSADMFTDDVESYKYGYWKSHALAPTKANNTLPPPHRLRSPGMNNAHVSDVQDSQPDSSSVECDEPSSQTERPTSEPEEWPMTKPTDQNWYEANKQRTKHDSFMSQASTGYSYPIYMQESRPQTEVLVDEHDLRGPDRFSCHNRPASRASHTHTARASTNMSRQSAEAASISRPGSSSYNSACKSAGMSATYNNDLFEASGGRKRSGFASRLLMSAEEKRKLKVKESIVVVGGAKMGGNSSNSGRDSGKPLVSIQIPDLCT